MLFINLLMWILWVILMIWNLFTTAMGLMFGLAVIAGQTPAGNVPASETVKVLMMCFACVPLNLLMAMGFDGSNGSDAPIYAAFAIFILGWLIAIAFPIYKLCAYMHS